VVVVGAVAVEIQVQDDVRRLAIDELLDVGAVGQLARRSDDAGDAYTDRGREVKRKSGR